MGSHIETHIMDPGSQGQSRSGKRDNQLNIFSFFLLSFGLQ